MAFMHSKWLIKLQGRRVIGKCCRVRNEIAGNSRDASFLFDEDFTKIALATIRSPEIKSLIDQLVLNHCLGSGLYEDRMSIF